jgi:hypothetical protein
MLARMIDNESVITTLNKTLIKFEKELKKR